MRKAYEIKNVRVLKNGSMKRPVADVVKSQSARNLFRKMDGLISKASSAAAPTQAPPQSRELATAGDRG